MPLERRDTGLAEASVVQYVCALIRRHTTIGSLYNSTAIERILDEQESEAVPISGCAPFPTA
uniref:Transposase n=1 Tax=Mesocestoides corti TaxID=53468 RepID=A0A5K3F9N5_MESCO